MNIEEAFEEVLRKPSAGCCLNESQIKSLRFRYRNGASIGHQLYLELLRCNGYIINVVKDDDPERIKEVISP